MDDQLDNDLKNHIIEVFENFEAPSADEGWLLLRKKFPEEEKRRPVAWLWWSAAAAILLVFFGLAIFMNNKPEQSKKFTYKKSIKANPQPDLAISKKAAPAEEQTAVNNSSPISNKVGIVNQHLTSPVNKNITPIIVADNSASGNYFKGNESVLATNNAPVKAADSSQIQPNKTAVKPAETNNQTESIAANTNTGSIITKKPTRSISSMFDNDKNNVQSVAEKPTDKNLKKVSFGVYAATYINYAKGSDNQLNAGVGVTSDIRISRNLKFSTGVILAQNSLNYNSAPLKASDGGDLSYISPSAQHAYSVASAPVAANYGLASAKPVFKNYNASLMGLDIPLNLKYEFNPQKSATYISAGLSSGTFVNEVYTYSYLNPLSQQTEDSSTHNNFNNFYFAKTVNFSFGIGYPLGKSNLLIIEPFVKYPIDGLGSQQIKFGAGGINFKFNFKSAPK